MGNLIEQAEDLLPKINSFRNAKSNQALEDVIQRDLNKFETVNAKLELATLTFRKLKESGVDLKKPRALSKLKRAQRLAKAVSDELNEGLEANQITHELNKLRATAQQSFWDLLDSEFTDLSEVLNKALEAEYESYCKKMNDPIADIPGNPAGQEVADKLNAAWNYVCIPNRTTIDLKGPFFSNSELENIIQVRQKWKENLDIWEENWPKYQEIIGKESPEIQKFFEDAASTGAPLSAFTPEVKERLTEGGSFDDYVIKKKSG